MIIENQRLNLKTQAIKNRTRLDITANKGIDTVALQTIDPRVAL